MGGVLASPTLQYVWSVLLIVFPLVVLWWQENQRYTENRGQLYPLANALALIYLPLLFGFLALPPAREKSKDGVSWLQQYGLMVPIASVLLVGGLWAYAASVLFKYSTDALPFYPYSPFKADMLPFIESCLRAFWRDFEYPYQQYQIATWYTPSVYLPALLLSHTPPFFLRLDLRIFQLIYVALMILLLFWQALSVALERKHPAAWLSFLTPVGFVFIPWGLYPFFDFIQIMHIAFAWLVAVAFVLALRSRTFLIAGLLFGLCGMTRPWFVFLLPPVTIYCVRTWGSGRSSWIRFWGGAFFVGCVLGLPFFLYDPQTFYFHILKSYEEYIPTRLAVNPETGLGFGFSEVFRQLGLDSIRMLVCLGLLGGWLALACWRVRTQRDVIHFGAAGMMILGLFAVIPFFYVFFLPLILLMCVGGPKWIEPERPLSERLPSIPLGRGLWMFIVVFSLCFSLAFPALHMKHRQERFNGSIDGVDGLPLVDSILIERGNGPLTWRTNYGATPRRLDASEFIAAFFVDSIDGCCVRIDMEQSSDNPVPIQVVLNGEVLEPSLEIPPGVGKQELFYGVPEMTLSRSANRIEIYVGSREALWAPDDVMAAGVSFWQIQAVP